MFSVQLTPMTEDRVQSGHLELLLKLDASILFYSVSATFALEGQQPPFLLIANDCRAWVS
ncbi:hypothetical protein NIES2098_20290 [Calothrix sp. NIES-2098]|nr:hypothetical protein NIES2098_20290 [Calothrix sp. NIES-2098]